MKNQIKSLFIFLLLSNAFFSASAQRGRPIIERRSEYHPIDKSNIHLDPTSEKLEILKKGNPYGKNSSEKEQIDYCRVQYELLEHERNSFFNNIENRTEDISKLKIFISNAPTFINKDRNDKEFNKDYNNSRFYSNYGIKIENSSTNNAGYEIKNLDYKNYEFSFKSAFGDNSPNSIIKNAHFIFQVGSIIGKNEREILAKSKKTYLQLPSGTKECTYSEKNDKLYYKNGNHFIEAPRSIEDYYIVKEAIERKMNFDKNVVISFIDDAKTEELLKEKFGNHYIKIDKQQKFDAIEQLLINHKNDRIILVGHIETNAFAPNNKNKFNFHLPLDKLNQIQANLNLCLYALGCNSITNGSRVGYSSNINSTKIVGAIYEATQKQTYDDFFDAMSIGDNKFFVNSQFIGNQIRFEADFKQYQQKVIKEINKKIEKSGEISKAIVYSQINENKVVPSPPVPLINDENTLLNFLGRVFKVVAGLSIIIWLSFKIFSGPKSTIK